MMIKAISFLNWILLFSINILLTKGQHFIDLTFNFEKTITCGDGLSIKKVELMSIPAPVESMNPCECYLVTKIDNPKALSWYLRPKKPEWTISPEKWSTYQDDLKVLYLNISSFGVPLKSSRSDTQVLQTLHFPKSLSQDLLLHYPDSENEDKATVSVYCSGTGQIESVLAEETDTFFALSTATVKTVIIPIVVGVIIIILIILCCCYKCWQSRRIRRSNSCYDASPVDRKDSSCNGGIFIGTTSNNNLYSAPKDYPESGSPPPRSPTPTAPLSQHEDLSHADSEESVSMLKAGYKTEAQIHHEDETA